MLMMTGMAGCGNTQKTDPASDVAEQNAATANDKLPWLNVIQDTYSSVQKVVFSGADGYDDNDN